MSTSAPWNFQPATKDTGNVKLFNPQENTSLQNGQIPSTDGGNVTHPSSWNNTGWEPNNQYGQYNNVMNDDGTVQNTGESHDQNEYQAQQFGESQQFYNLNPGIQQSYNQGQFIQQNDPQGQPIQQYDPQSQPIQQYDPQGQPIQQYDPQSQPIQQYGPQCQPIQQYGPQCQPIPQYDPQDQPIQQYDPQGQAIQQYDPQGQAIQQFDPQGQPIQHYNQQYGLNNQWNNCDGYQQNWNGSLAEQPSSSAATEAQFNEETNPQSNYDENQECITNNSENIQNSDYTENIGNDSVPPMINENSIPSSDISTHDSSGLSSELDHNHLILQPPLQTEISGESLVTLDSSSTQLTGEDSQLNIENQMEHLSVQEKSENSVKSGDVNHSAVDGQASSVDGNPSKTSKDSPVNSQTSDDWEMVPSAHNLLAPSNHSRQGSADSSSNVHFFIGSTNISPSGTPDGEVTHQSDKKQEESSPPSMLIPKHSSSPMPPRSGVPPQKHGDSQPSSSLGQGPPTMPPPTGSISTESNPFRKGNRSGGGQNSAKSVPTSNLTQSGEKGETTPTSKNDELKLDVSVAEGGFPSPIPAVPEESQNPPSQSPIMPRKESPFQPPRRRNMSQSSNSFDDENVPLHSDQRLTGSHKSDHMQKENDNIERKVGGADRKIGPMKADRPFRSMMQSTSERQQDSRVDYNKYSSYRGKDEKRPRSPITSSSVRNPGSGRITPTRPPTGRTTPTKPSSGRTTPGRSTPSRRLEREAYQKVVERRKKENVSPATSLWANNDIVPKTNILLAPAAPLQSTTPIIGVLEQKHRVETREVLSPVENLITTMTDHLSRENSPEKDVAKSKTTTQDVNRRENTQKDRHERNSSIDREIEMTKRMEDRERLHVYENNRDRPYKDDRNNRGPVRDDRNPAYRDDRQRDSRDYRDRDRDYDRDKYYDAYYEKQRQDRSRDPYYNDERYERPRSRQSASKYMFIWDLIYYIE
jgi:YD repeat-containing protein